MGLIEKKWNLVLFFAIFTTQIQSFFSYPNEELENGETFDFIVVGAGTAGCAVATRLAESGKHTVLLIEGGGLPDPNMDIRALGPGYVRYTNHVKHYPSVPQKNAGLATKGIINFRLGQVLGGSSAINGLVINRGSPHDYNNWARVAKDDSWNYQNMLKYFKKYENYTVKDHLRENDQSGFDGPIQIERPQFAPALEEWLRAGQELGYELGEPNGPQKLSFTKMDSALKNGRRVSSYKGYIKPWLNKAKANHSRFKTNLLILIETEVKRIIFDGRRAVGVKFLTKNGTTSGYAKASKEVILTAGVIDSALLLMKSGVGPKSVLEEANIPVVKYLPVGRNLNDHVSVTIALVIGNNSAALIPERDFNQNAWRMLEKYGDGPYTSFLGGALQAFVQSSKVSPFERGVGWPNLHLIPMMTTAGGIVGDTGMITDLKDWEAPVRMASFLTRPKSRGTVILNSTDIDGRPLIDFQYFTHPDDLPAMLDGIKLLLEICEKTYAFQSLGCRVPTNPLPACSHLKVRSESYWICYVQQMAATGIHAGGTCKMGSGPEDLDAVVDSKLRVIGIDGLRVGDASIMPAVTNANTQGAVYAIAEKVADIILNQWDNDTAPGLDNFNPEIKYSYNGHWI